jgi:hypothetical protein
MVDLTLLEKLDYFVKCGIRVDPDDFAWKGMLGFGWSHGFRR